MEKHEKSPKEPGNLRQFFVALIVNLSAMSYGTMIGWQSPSTPQLQSPTPPIGKEPMTNEGISWLGGIMCLGGAFMTVLLSVIPDKFSRKRIGYLVALPLIISWLLIIFATQHIYIFVARLFSGVGGASMFFFSTLYMSEISNDSIRGLLGSILVFLLNFGVLFSYILGGQLSMLAFAVVGLIVPILYFIGLIFIPESPVYLVRRNRMEEATKSLVWLKAGNKRAAGQTLSHLEVRIKELESTKTAKFSDLFRDKATIKGLIITLGLFIAQQLSGIGITLNYAETIFKMSGSSLSPNMSSIIVGAIQLVGSFLSSFLVERTGRRLLLLISCAGMCACHTVIGVFCYLQILGYNVSDYSSIPVIALSTYMIVYAMGMGMVPIVVMAEIFSQDVSSLGSAVSLSCLWFISFVMLKIFPNIIALVGIHGCFFLFAASCACSFIFGFVLLPETKGRMREDIVQELNGQSMKNEKSTKQVIGIDSMYADPV